MHWANYLRKELVPLLQVMPLTIHIHHLQILPSAEFEKNNLLILINEKLSTRNVIQSNDSCDALLCLASTSLLYAAAFHWFSKCIRSQ